VDQQRYSRLFRPVAGAAARAHVAARRVSRGRVGRKWRGGELVLLSTTGRRSGRRRTTPLVCLRDGPDIIVVASNGGSDRPPDWWLNLKDHHRADVDIAGLRVPVIAREARGDRAVALSEAFAAAFPCFRGYQRRTSREIPVVVLHPLVA
jgi:deazaflavin-dependent oxidoreductase (nitroreductase family)